MRETTHKLLMVKPPLLYWSKDQLLKQTEGQSLAYGCIKD
jgi:hypothetical protein